MWVESSQLAIPVTNAQKTIPLPARICPGRRALTEACMEPAVNLCTRGFLMAASLPGGAEIGPFSKSPNSSKFLLT